MRDKSDELMIDDLLKTRPRCRNYKELYLEALEKGGVLTWDDGHIDIILKGAIQDADDLFASSGIPSKDIVGLYVRPLEGYITTYLAVVDDVDVVPKNIVAWRINAEATINEIIAKSVIEWNQCSLCHRDIPIGQQKNIHYQHYCPECYALSMKEQKQEQQLAGLYGEI